MTTLAFNKKASHKYVVLETFEAGIALFGYEVKAVREGKANFEGSFIKIVNSKPVLINLDIARYSKLGQIAEFDSRRTRNLLINKKEIERLESKLKTKGLTLAPLKFYTDHGLIKLSFGLVKGKKEPQRKEDVKARQQKIDLKRAEKEQFSEEI